jgi:hypothetical protein
MRGRSFGWTVGAGGMIEAVLSSMGASRAPKLRQPDPLPRLPQEEAFQIPQVATALKTLARSGRSIT